VTKIVFYADEGHEEKPVYSDPDSTGYDMSDYI